MAELIKLNDMWFLVPFLTRTPTLYNLKMSLSNGRRIPKMEFSSSVMGCVSDIFWTMRADKLTLTVTES